jgi:UDP-N-acetyl-2-amino-2-deoxyglucuronate dehydrogenase
MSINFALIGAAGYVAPRHLSAIFDTGNVLLAAMDPHDSVGILDHYFPGADFFTEFERFDRHTEKLRRKSLEERVHMVSICSPNYLHDAHIRFALRLDADAICEKPLVLNPWNLDALIKLEEETGRRVHPVLQLRYHPDLLPLKQRYACSGRKHKVVMTYVTSRGQWYHYSWKGAPEKSGGIATNIGIHLFDLLIWLFGPVQRSEVHHSDAVRMAGFIELERAEVDWLLSIDASDLPEGVSQSRTHRSIVVDGEEVEFSNRFTSLHTTVYKEVLEGRGFRIQDAAPSIQLAHDIRNSVPLGIRSLRHPLLVNKRSL